MALDIEHNETLELILQLAAMTGEDVTEAITKAVQERIERLQLVQGYSLADRLLAIGKDTAARIPLSNRSISHAALLYDEDGLSTS